MKLGRIVSGALVLTLLLAACGGGSSSIGTGAPAATKAATKDDLSGRVTLKGGGGALDVVKALTEAFTKVHPNVTWVLEDTGSDAGYSLTASGEYDLGMASRLPKDTEKANVQTQAIGFSATGIVVNATNPVTSLTTQQIHDAFAGIITDWKDLGGTPGPINILLREKTASTRSVFESAVFKAPEKPTYAKSAVETVDGTELTKALRSFTGALGMDSIHASTLIDKTIKVLKVDGVDPSGANLQNGTYKMARPLQLIYKTEKLTPVTKAFLDFVNSPDGQKIITSQ